MPSHQDRAIVLKEHRILFLSTPKTGCTSVKWQLADVAGLSRDHFRLSTMREVTRGLTIHDLRLWGAEHRWADLDDAEQARIQESGDWLRFSVVRNPAARVWSAWQSKVLLAEPQFVERFGQEPWFPSSVSSLDEVIACFRDFVHALDVAPESRPTDPHWALQQELLDGVDLNFIGRAENPTGTLERLEKHLGRPLARNMPRENPNPVPYAPEVYDPAAAEILNRLYQTDLRAYDYPELDPPAPARVADDEWRARSTARLPLVAALRERHLRLGDVFDVLDRTQEAALMPNAVSRFSTRAAANDVAADGKPVGLFRFIRQTRDGQFSWQKPDRTTGGANHGDFLDSASLVRHVGTTPTAWVGPDSEPRRDLRAVLMRGSTYLSPEWDFMAATAALEAMDGPVAAIGLGLRSAHDDLAVLDGVPGAERFVRILTERSASVSVMGDYTAAVLERLGATSLRVTGSPSVFQEPEPPRVIVPETLSLPQRHLGLSLTSGLRTGPACRDAEAARQRHGRLIRFALRPPARVSLFSEGAVLEHAVGDRELPLEERLNAARELAARLPGHEDLRPIALVTRMANMRSVDEWLWRTREVDALLSSRLHSSAVALSQGVPTSTYGFDSRLDEFSRLYQLPCLDVEEPWTNPVRSILEHDWHRTNRAIESCHRELVAFYNENGIPHTLRPVASS